MLLREFIKNITDYPPATINQLLNDPDVGEKIGGGSFGKVYRNKSNPHEVIKIGFTENIPTRDGYLGFLNNIKRLKLTTFPQVYNIEVFQNVDPEDKRNHPFIFKVHMEKLIPTKQLNSSEIVSLSERFFGSIPATDEERIHYKTYDKIAYFLDQLKRYLQYDDSYDKSYSSHVVQPTRKEIPDAQLRLALRAMRKTLKDFRLDLHDENIMFRRTPYGVMPVFTDPFAFPR